MAKILVIDDDPDLHALICRYLENDYDVLKSGDGADALQKLVSEKPDAILTDVLMPRMSGYDFYKEIKKMPAEIRDIPIIVMSSRESMKDFFDAWSIVSFLKKPFTKEDLLSAVDGALKRKAVQLSPDAKPKARAEAPRSSSGEMPQGNAQKTKWMKYLILSGTDESVLKKLKEYLLNRNYQVEVAINEDEVMVLAEKIQPQMVFCQDGDEGKGFDAVGVAARLKASRKTANIPYFVYCAPDRIAELARHIPEENIISFDRPSQLIAAIDMILM